MPGDTAVMSDALADACAFGAALLRRPLWEHQASLARSKARYRVVCAGRQVGKSTGVSVIALFEAATRPNILVLVVSAGEEASKRLLAECAALLQGSPLLRGSVVDESRSVITLSNGSTIRSVPASVKQIRGWPVDLLIVDEAAFVDQTVWQSAEPSIIARPGSRIILLSSPWGDSEHFFRRLWNRGMDHPDSQVEAWHWPSSISPLVDRDLLESIRARESDEYFRREFLAEWTDDAGAYFSESEIMACVADYGMTAPEDLTRWLPHDGVFPYSASGGIDWGMARDANALVLLSVAEDHLLNVPRLGDGLLFYIPWLEVRHKWSYADFINRIVEVAGKYHLPVIASETNGVGAFPTQRLGDLLREKDRDSFVWPVTTDARRKQSGFGKLKGLMQEHRIVLPRHPELLRQLRGLQFEQMPSGVLRISVPESFGHDDIALALMQAVSAVDLRGAIRWGEADAGWNRERPFAGETVVTSEGMVVPAVPLPVLGHDSALFAVEGREKSEPW